MSKGMFMIAAGCVSSIIISAVFAAFGAHVPYFLSYMRIYDPTLKYSDIALLVALNNVAFNTLSWFSGFMIRSWGLRKTAATASVLLSVSTSLCYFAIQNYWAFVCCTSLIAFFSAITQATVIVCCMEWGKRHKGIAIGIISFAESCGATFFSVIGTLVINPHNLQTDVMDGDGNGYFSQPEILNRIPLYFFGLGIVSFLCLLPTACVISFPPDDDEKNKLLTEDSEDDLQYVRSVRSICEGDYSHASFPGYKSRTVSQSSYRKHSNRLDSAISEEDITFIEESSPDDWYNIFKQKDFYLITIVYSAAKICRTILMTFYKAYGLTVISNDQFLTTIAVTGNFANALGRLVWGFLSDRYRSKYLIFAAALCGIVGVELTYWCVFSSWHPDFLYMAAIALDGVIFASQILFTTSLYTFFGKKDFGIKYGLVRAGPGLAVLGFSFLLKYVNIFEEWSVIYHSMAIICIFSGMVSIALTNHSVVKL